MGEDTGDPAYENIAILIQAQMEAMGVVEKEYINLVIPQIAKQFDKNKISKHEILKGISRLGVYLYTAPKEEGGPYAKVNEALSTDKLDEFKKFENPIGFISLGFLHLCSEFSDKFKANPNKKVFRGMKNLTDEQFEEFLDNQEKTFHWPQFVSTTRDIEVAKKFARKDFDNDTEPAEESVIFEITLIEQSLAIILDDVSHYQGEDAEKEILLYPYQQFRIDEVRWVDFPGRGIVYLTMVPPVTTRWIFTNMATT